MATYLNLTAATAPPHYYDSGSHSSGLIVASGCMAGLTTISLALRFTSRYLSTKASFWWDDWCALIAWAFLIPQIAFLIDSTHYGIGRHEGTLDRHQWERFNLDLFLGSLLYNLGLTATKLSVLFFYKRIFSWTRDWFRWAMWFAFFLCSAWCIAITFLSIFQCNPVRFYWVPFPVGTCLDSFSIALGTSIPNVVIDVFILWIPVPFVYQLEVSFKRKIGVAIVFLTGYATLALSITRVAISAELTTKKIQDYTWNSIPFLIMVNLEPGIGLISACLPAQVYLLRRFLVDVCGVNWTSAGGSTPMMTRQLKENSKRKSDIIRSMLDTARWRNLSNVGSISSYQAQVSVDRDRDNTNSEEIEGIHVLREVIVRPSSWTPQFVQLLLG